MADYSKTTQVDSAQEDAVRRNREDQLAREILDYARQSLTLELRFLDAALNRLRLFILPERGLSTDGRALGYDPRFILRSYQAEQTQIAHFYLHTVLHCVFQHVFQASRMDRTLWDIACDAAVEYVISGLDAQAVRCTAEAARKEEFDALKKALPQVTAEQIYRFYQESSLPPERIAELGRLFRADDHFPWYSPEPLQKGESRSGGNQGGRCQAQSEKGKTTEGGSGEQGKELPEQQEQESGSQEDWQDVARRMQMELETLGRKRGMRGGAMVQALKAVNRERYDYASFLRKFSVMGEHLKLDQNEFDYIFYTYGLKLYGNLPLIEPLEYSEDRHVREFVIAIDTSGSVRGPLVQAFVQKTYNILKSTESFASRVNIHIIQCDKEIQEHVKITSLQEFEGYMRTMKLKGFGGTDFRPVFRYVDRLIENKEFCNLRGLLYFTDGRGEFPRKKPSYETAFVFLEQAENNAKAPPWSIQLTLPKEEIEQP